MGDTCLIFFRLLTRFYRCNFVLGPNAPSFWLWNDPECLKAATLLPQKTEQRTGLCGLAEKASTRITTLGGKKKKGKEEQKGGGVGKKGKIHLKSISPSPVNYLRRWES